MGASAASVGTPSLCGTYRMLGAGFEPAWGCPRGILSRKPTPREVRLHSERHRQQPHGFASNRRKLGTAADTAEDDSDDEDSPAPNAAEPLGNTTKKPSTGCATLATNRQARRAARYELRDLLNELSSLPRVANCGRFRVSAEVDPELRRCRADDGRFVAHFAKLQLCGRIWACPVCGPRIRSIRANELDLACQRWMERYGTGSVLLLTLTLPHDFGQPLSNLLSTIRASFSSLVSGRRWQADKASFGIAHYARAHDLTVGPNGWHPHLHLVLLLRTVPDALAISRLRARLYRRWHDALARLGCRPPHPVHGVVLEQARSRRDATGYVCQVVTGAQDRAVPIALEVARGDLKSSAHLGHRTPWQVLAAIPADGDGADLALLHEFEQATIGVQAIRFSRGLRKELELGEALTDEEIVALEVGGEVVHVFSPTEWRAACSTRGARARILECAESGGPVAVAAFLANILSLRAAA